MFKWGFPVLGDNFYDVLSVYNIWFFGFQFRIAIKFSAKLLKLTNNLEHCLNYENRTPVDIFLTLLCSLRARKSCRTLKALSHNLT